MDKQRKKELERAWRQANVERLREYRRVYREANGEGIRERDRLYRQANSEKLRKKDAEYYAANKDLIREKRRTYFAEYTQRPEVKAATLARCRARQAGCKERTPTWADMRAIKEVYLQAQTYRDEGFDVHVDHYYPLQGKKVSGLHVHNNLRIVFAVDNLVKGNKHPE